MNELYNTLGLDKTASADEIKKSYRKLAVENHPDKEGGDSEKMKEITAAYNILKDPVKRERYDTTGETNPEDSFENRFRNMINNVFGAIVDTENDVDYKDLIEVLRYELMRQEDLNRRSLNNLRLELQKLENVLKRVKKDDGYIKPVIESKIENANRAISVTEINIEFICACIKKCANFEYEVDKEPENSVDSYFVDFNDQDVQKFFFK